MSQFNWLTLDNDEEIILSDNPVMNSIIPSLIIGIPTIPLLGLGIIIIAGAYYRIKNTEYVVSSDGLYKKTGIFSRSVKKIGFDKVQNISFGQGIFGKKFGYGNVNISTAGGSGVEMQFKSIKNPKEIQEKITNLMKDEKTKEDRENKRKEKEILKDILTELEEINEKM